LYTIGKQTRSGTSRRSWKAAALIAVALAGTSCATGRGPLSASAAPAAKGKYLATIGVCEACHTPPAVPETGPLTFEQEQLRKNPDWFRYLDDSKRYAGGVPFIVRLSGESHGVVYTRNITPDIETGIGRWTKAQIIDALRTGRRPDGSNLLLFPPHTFYRNLSDEDADALATYLLSLPPIRNQVAPRSLPFDPPAQAAVPVPAVSPKGATEARAQYLTHALVGCRECHSYTAKGEEHPWMGGDRQDPFNGTFRLGPDLPLRQLDRGFSAFPYPGYAVLFGTNLTRFGKGGDLEGVARSRIERAIRTGVAVEPDRYGRERPLAHVMMWQFYREMSDDDVRAIASHVKRLQFVPHDVGNRLRYFGTDWAAAFEYVFGEPPTAADRAAFGKP
jgi:cytochrome c553